MSATRRRATPPARRFLTVHLPFWAVIALATLAAWGAYGGAALEADLAMLLSFCAGPLR